MFPFVAWRGAEGRAGSCNSSTPVPLHAVLAFGNCGSSWVSPRTEGFSHVSIGMSCCPPSQRAPSIQKIPFVQLILGGGRNEFCIFPGWDNGISGWDSFLKCVQGGWRLLRWVRCADVKIFTALTSVPHLQSSEAIKLTGSRVKAMRAGNQGANRGRCWEAPAVLEALLQNSMVLKGFTGIPPCASNSFGEEIWENFGWILLCPE